MLLLARVDKIEISNEPAMTLNISVSYEDGWNQNVCNIVLDTYNTDSKSRVGTAYGCELIRRVMSEFKLRSLQDLTSKIIWVVAMDNTSTLERKVQGIKPLRLDNSRGQEIIYQDILSYHK